MRRNLRAVLMRLIVATATLSQLAAGAQLQPGRRNAVIELDHGWQFRQAFAGGSASDTPWLPASVPGDVHLDLLANKKIDDPFYRDNEAKLQWIENASWEYRLQFAVTPALLARNNIDLVFDGLDAAAQVYLNGVQVLDADNMFLIWRVPIQGHLRSGTNELRVVFPSPIRAAQLVAAKDPWQARTGAAAKTYIRKAAYEYGWDWGPRFVTSGIWRPVRIEAWDKFRIADFAVRQRDVSREVAHLDAEMEVEASSSGPAKVMVQYIEKEKPVTVAETVVLHAGSNLIDVPIEIGQPRLWYPAGYGDQPLYEFTAQIASSAPVADQRIVKCGLRSIVLDRHLDPWGRTFQLVVNGIPIFAKGAALIPFDSFPNRATRANYRRILESARDANMNMIRHWGGGYYETEEFYEICDELGLMVWQDFMFGNDWQPGTYDFKQNIEAEADDQVRRLRNHPSIVVWCGNNETESAFTWADRQKLAPEVRMQMWQDYLTEFSGILNRVVERLDAETPYWPSSPSADYEQLSDTFQSGDVHLWDVWHGRVPFASYETHHPRFVTEYGFQSFPEMRTIEAFTQPEDRSSIFTQVMLAHQKNKEGNSIIHDYMLRDYPEPKDFASFIYVSQVLQAEGIKIGAEHFRRSRPDTMGSIFWQLNDCWPVASWSSIDYYGRWKALQYYARRFYAPILVSPHVEAGSMKVYIVSDKTAPQPASLRVRLMDFDGRVLLEDKRDLNVEPLSNKVVLEWSMAKLTQAGAADTSRVFVAAELVDNTAPPSQKVKVLSRNLLYLAPTKEVRLKPAHLSVKIEGSNGNYTISLSSPVLTRDVYLSFGNLDVQMADNYFDLLPGESVGITGTSTASLDAIKSQLRVISLTDAFATTTGASVSASH